MEPPRSSLLLFLLHSGAKLKERKVVTYFSLAGDSEWLPQVSVTKGSDFNKHTQSQIRFP